MLAALPFGASIDDVIELRLARPLLGRLVARPRRIAYAFTVGDTLIDSGPPATAKELAKWVSSQPIRHLYLTHYHEDHAGGAPALNLPTYAPHASLAQLANPEVIQFHRKFAWAQPSPVQAIGFAPGDCLPTQYGDLSVIATPGHSADHVSFLLAERGWLFGGDVFVHPYIKYLRWEENPYETLRSLYRLLTYDFDTLFCGHAGIVTDAKAALRRKISYLESLRDHSLSLHQQGWTVNRISNHLLGREGLLTYISRNDLSKQNFINAWLTTPATSHP